MYNEALHADAGRVSEKRKRRKKMKRQRKTNQGFTLVELLIVIVIIGILAAVIIPNVANNIEKGRIASDVSDVRNMNTILSTYCLSNGIDATKLEAPEVRAIVSSEEKNFTFAPKGTQSTFWYNKNEGKIELAQQPLITPGGTSGSRLDSVYADFTPGSIEELVSGYLYLNTKDKTNVANLLFQLRNISESSDYTNSIVPRTESLPESVKAAVKKVVEEFDIRTTAYINASGAVIQSGANLKHFVFASDLKVVPSTIGIGIVSAADGVKIRIPATVEVVMPGAFSQICSSTKLELTKPETKILEGALSESIKAASSLSETKIDNNRIKEGNRRITVTVNGQEFGFTKLPEDNREELVKDPLSYYRELNISPLQSIIDTRAVAANGQSVKINTQAFLNAFSGVTSLTVIKTPKAENFYDITVMAFDGNGMVLNLLITIKEK